MRNIWRIIRADARSLFTHFFALGVALAIAVLPSLYAWLNIYSNWDPYGNTGNISIAVGSFASSELQAAVGMERLGFPGAAMALAALGLNLLLLRSCRRR